MESNLDQNPFATELGFITENVEEIIHIAKQNGATILEESKEEPWGQTVAYIRDIDGFLIEICTPINA